METPAGAPHAAWKAVWDRRQLDTSKVGTLAQLMAADGLDTPFGSANERDWAAWIDRWAATLAIAPGSSVFEVGCGAGAFLHVLAQMGCRVGGLDQSAALVRIARQAMAGGCFEVAHAAERELPAADFVVSCAVFLYFPSLEYADRVIRAMAGAAGTAVAILDLPDNARRDAALAHRRGTMADYGDRYDGLDHLYYDKEWMRATLERCGLVDVQVADQDLAGYANSAFRFNAWGFVPPASRRALR